MRFETINLPADATVEDVPAHLPGGVPPQNITIYRYGSKPGRSFR
jgi:hypothetical protein